MLREHPTMNPKTALKHAKSIVGNRNGIYKVTADQKNTSETKTPWTKLPEHVRLNIVRQQMAEEHRDAIGFELPAVHFVSGGKVSPR